MKYSSVERALRCVRIMQLVCCVGKSVCATSDLLHAVRPPKGNPNCICLPKRRKEMYGGPRKTKLTVHLQRFVLSIVEHRQSLNCCNSLIPVILIDVRVLLKLLGFSTKICVTDHSCQLVGLHVLSAICKHISSHSSLFSEMRHLANCLSDLQVFCSAFQAVGWHVLLSAQTQF